MRGRVDVIALALRCAGSSRASSTSRRRWSPSSSSRTRRPAARCGPTSCRCHHDSHKYMYMCVCARARRRGQIDRQMDGQMALYMCVYIYIYIYMRAASILHAGDRGSPRQPQIYLLCVFVHMDATPCRALRAYFMQVTQAHHDSHRYIDTYICVCARARRRRQIDRQIDRQMDGWLYICVYIYICALQVYFMQVLQAQHDSHKYIYLCMCVCVDRQARRLTVRYGPTSCRCHRLTTIAINTSICVCMCVCVQTDRRGALPRAAGLLHAGATSSQRHRYIYLCVRARVGVDRQIDRQIDRWMDGSIYVYIYICALRVYFMQVTQAHHDSHRYIYFVCVCVCRQIDRQK